MKKYRLAFFTLFVLIFLSQYVSAEEIILPSSTVIIGEEAFSDDRFVARAVVPSGCKTIGDNALSNCSYLNSVAIPDSVNYIGENAFANADRLVICRNENSHAKSYAAPHGVETVPFNVTAAGKCGDDAFWKLTGDGVLDIGI